MFVLKHFKEAKTCLPPSMLRCCSVLQTLSKQQMSSVDRRVEFLLFFFSFFSQQFAYFVLAKRVKCSAILYSRPKTTQPLPQVFSINCLVFWQLCCTIDVNFRISQNSSKFGQQQLVMMNPWDFSQSQTEKYFERIIIKYHYHYHQYCRCQSCYQLWSHYRLFTYVNFACLHLAR